MSIYASGADVGMDDYGRHTGEVLIYRKSHVFPTPSDPTAWLGLGAIPGYCVPGHDEEDDDLVAEYLRLDMSADGKWVTSTVVLTVAGAKRLRDELTDWLNAKKAIAP
jgi:hypothetical protein